MRLLVSIGPANLPRLYEIALDASSLIFTFVLSLLSGLLLGSIPAWKYSPSRAAVSLNPARTISASRERHRSQDILVIAQVAMTVVLLVSAILMIRTFQQLREVNPGFTDPRSLQTLHIEIPDTTITDPGMVTRVQNNIAEELASIPGVTSVGFAGSLPMEGIKPFWSLIYSEDSR